MRLVLEYRLVYKLDERKKERDVRVSKLGSMDDYHKLLLADCARDLERDRESQKEVLKKLDVPADIYEKEVADGIGDIQEAMELHTLMLAKAEHEGIDTETAKQVYERYTNAKFTCGNELSISNVTTLDMPPELKENKFERLCHTYALDQLHSTDNLDDIEIRVTKAHLIEEQKKHPPKVGEEFIEY